MTGKIFVVSGPSGVGKTSLVQEVLRQWQASEVLKRSVTYTTRPPRENEVNGKDYYFVTKDLFVTKEQEGFFLETNQYCGYFYGSPKDIIETSLRTGVSFVVILDQEGARVLSHIPHVILIWIMPPNIQTLENRLKRRDGEKRETYKERLEKAQNELAQEEKEHLYQFHIVNDDFLKTVKKLKELMGRLIRQESLGA